MRTLHCAVLVGVVGCLGCGFNAVHSTFEQLAGKSAAEVRTLTEKHVADSPIDVFTPSGRIDVVADPKRSEVEIVAKISVPGESEEEAKPRLKDVKVVVQRKDDGTLKIAAEMPNDKGNIRGSCSFVVKVPGAKGVKLETGAGSLSAQGLGGDAKLRTNVGGIESRKQAGQVDARSGSGSITVEQAGGPVNAETNVGGVKVHGAAGSVKAKSGSGSIEVVKAGGTVSAHTNVGGVTVREVADTIDVSTGSGSITIAGGKSVKAKTNVGGVTITEAAGDVDASSGSGSIQFTPGKDANTRFDLNTNVGSVSVTLPASATGTIDAKTNVGNVTVGGGRTPKEVKGDRNSKTIVLGEAGPTSKIRSGSGSITVTVD